MNGKEKVETPEVEVAKKSKGKLALNIVLYVFLGLLLVFDGFALYSKISMKGANGTMSFFGHETRIVLTGSMVGTDEFYASHPEYEIKRIEIHDAVFVKTAPAADASQSKIDEFYKDITVGDILTFIDQTHNSLVVSHRIIDVQKLTNPVTHGTVYYYTLLGDNPKAQDDEPQHVSSDSGLILGQVTGSSKFLGRFLYAFVGNKLVVILTVIVPCGVFAIYEIVKIIIVVNKTRAEKALADNQKAMSEKDDELERLRNELEEMKKKNNSGEEK